MTRANWRHGVRLAVFLRASEPSSELRLGREMESELLERRGRTLCNPVMWEGTLLVYISAWWRAKQGAKTCVYRKIVCFRTTARGFSFFKLQGGVCSYLYFFISGSAAWERLTSGGCWGSINYHCRLVAKIYRCTYSRIKLLMAIYSSPFSWFSYDVLLTITFHFCVLIIYMVYLQK